MLRVALCRLSTPGTSKTSRHISFTRNTVIIDHSRDYLSEAVFSKGRTLVCVPTRSLAEHTLSQLYKSRKDKNVNIFLDSAGADVADAVVVTTPGRLGKTTEKIDRVVLKEADLLLSVPMVVDTLRKLPTETQRIFLSATLDPWFKDLLTDATIGAPFDVVGTPLGVQGKVDLPGVRHEAAVVTGEERVEVITQACRQSKGLVFMTKTELITVQTASPQGWMFMHSGQLPSVRRSVLRLFGERQAGVLAVTDAVGRGLEFADVGKIFHLGCPATRDGYLQRLVSVVSKSGVRDFESLVLCEKKRDVFQAQKNLGLKFGSAEGLLVGDELKKAKVRDVVERLLNDQGSVDPVVATQAKEIFKAAENKEELVSSALALFMKSAHAETTSVLSGMADHQAILLVDPKMRSIRSRTEAKRAVINTMKGVEIKLGRIALSKYGFIVDVPSEYVGRVLEQKIKKLRLVALSSLPELVENESLHKHLWAKRDKRSVEHKMKQSVRWR